jgi:predicted Zn-dependent protease
MAQRGVVRWLVLAVVSVGLSTAGTGCKVDTQQELSLGEQQHGTFEQQSGGRYPDQAVQGYVGNVGLSMVKYAARPEMKWQFHVLNSSQINAFAVPGGYIYITQGLLFKLQNEAQLAGVLGHEIGHIAKRHSAKSIETQQTVGVLTAGASVLASAAGYGAAGDLANVTAQLGMLKYSRAHETEADYCGLEYMTRQGYNPMGIVQVMQILKAAAGSGGGGPLGDWTSTHPDPGNRVEYLTAAINKNPVYKSATQSGRWGVPEFQAGVLSRRPTAMLEVPAEVVWCVTCARENRERRVARGRVGGELLHDVQ